MEGMRPKVVIVAGINGAGKTTASERLLKEFEVGTYLDADAMERELAGDPAGTAIRAGRMMRARMDELRSARASFALETTLSGLSLRRSLEQLHAAGYESYLLYLWLPSARLAVSRVSGRVRQGGHHIPAEDILRRYLRSVYNFEAVYRHLVTEWRVYDATQSAWSTGEKVVARGDDLGRIEVFHRDVWNEIQAQSASQSNREGTDE